MNNEPFNAVGIDVSKGKSTIAVMRPFGEIILSPFEITHSSSDLKMLSNTLKELDGDTRIIMEYTGKYYQPIAHFLYDSGFFVSVIHAKLIHDFANNSIRKIKTDKADAVKSANYGLSNWQDLKPFSKDEDIRILLKSCNRQYNLYIRQYVTAKNNLISLLDQTCPGLDKIVAGKRRPNGQTKWIDVAHRFWHCEYITSFSEKKFTEIFNDWCKKNGYKRDSIKASQIYKHAKDCVPTLPKNEYTKAIMQNAAEEAQHLSTLIISTQSEMNRLAELLPEYPIVMSLNGVGETLGPQLIAEIGDVRRFPNRSNLIAYAGIDAPPFQSGKYEAKSRHISKRGSSELRKTLFQVVGVIQQQQMYEDSVHKFILKKKAEGKPYYVCMIAGCNKFLRIYYARVKEYLNSIENS